MAMARKTKTPKAADHLQLGAFFYRSGSYDLAIEQFVAASKRAPHLPNVWLNLGVAYIDKGELQKAKESLERALKLKPDYPPAYFHLGVLYERLGDLERARESFNRVIDLDRYGELGRRASEIVGGSFEKVIFSLHQ